MDIDQINEKIDELIDFQEYLRDSIAEVNSKIEKLLIIKIGPEGKRGERGEKGDKGNEGKEGPIGKGEKGDRGSPGRDGRDGCDGKNGCDGKKGKKGKNGKNCTMEFTEFLVKIVNIEETGTEFVNIKCIGSLIIRNQNFECCKNIESIYIKVKNNALYFELVSTCIPKSTYISANGKTIESELISYSYSDTNKYKFCFDDNQNMDDYFYPGCVFSFIFYWY